MSEPVSILVVDDYPPYVDTLAEVLDDRGFKVHTANSGIEALEILQEHPVDILLTDVQMPGMNGVELYQETRKICPAITAILMTADSTNELIHQGSAEGIKAILDKPLDVQFLFALISFLTKTNTSVQ